MTALSLIYCMRHSVQLFLSQDRTKSFLLKKGVHLIIHAGLILGWLHAIKSDFSPYFEGKALLPIVLSMVWNAFAWLFPLVFAGLGVNVLSEAVLKKFEGSDT